VANTNDIQFRMKCRVCGRPFLVDNISSKVPEHPEKALPIHPDILYVRCNGSGLGGIVAGTVMRTPGKP
jgi:hypothetical protein